MKVKNSLGFTLIELIATITILGIIMLIAVPNVISVVTKNKNQTYVNDARKFVTLAKYKSLIVIKSSAILISILENVLSSA